MLYDFSPYFCCVLVTQIFTDIFYESVKGTNIIEFVIDLHLFEKPMLLIKTALFSCYLFYHVSIAFLLQWGIQRD